MQNPESDYLNANPGSPLASHDILALWFWVHFITHLIFILVQSLYIVCALSSLTLCDPVDCSPPCSSVHRTFQARTLEWVVISFSVCSLSRYYEPYFAYGITEAQRDWHMKMLTRAHGTCCAVWSHFSHVRLFVILWTVAQQTPLSMGFFGQRIPKWVAMSSSRGSSQPSDWTCVSCIAGGCQISICQYYCWYLLLVFLGI